MSIKKSLSIFQILAIIFVSCAKQNNSSLLDNVKYDIDSLAKIYAPDTRTELWNISITNDDDKLSIMAEVANKKAKIDLFETLSTKYPAIEINVNLLPENNTNSPIDALVNNSVSSIRAKAKHRAELINQALLGSPIKIFKEDRGWFLVQTPNYYLGWINADDIVMIDSTELNEYKAAKKIIYHKQSGFSYSSPNIKSEIVTDLVIGCILPVVDSKKDFYKVKYPDNRIAFVKKEEVVDMGTIFNKVPKRDELIKTAKKFMGIPYLWGGFSSKLIDCSGFTSIIYFLNGIVLQRDASQQIRYGKEITKEFKYNDLLVGDLLFFGRKATDSIPEKVTHVGMYIGNSEFIHASGKVKINSMDSTKTNYISHYNSTFIKTVRVIDEEEGYNIEKITNNKFYKNIIPD